MVASKMLLGWPEVDTSATSTGCEGNSAGMQKSWNTKFDRGPAILFYHLAHASPRVCSSLTLLTEQSFTKWHRKSLPEDTHRFRTNIDCVGFPRLKHSYGELTPEPLWFSLQNRATAGRICLPINAIVDPFSWSVKALLRRRPTARLLGTWQECLSRQLPPRFSTGPWVRPRIVGRRGP